VLRDDERRSDDDPRATRQQNDNRVAAVSGMDVDGRYESGSADVLRGVGGVRTGRQRNDHRVAAVNDPDADVRHRRSEGGEAADETSCGRGVGVPDDVDSVQIGRQQSGGVAVSRTGATRARSVIMEHCYGRRRPTSWMMRMESVGGRRTETRPTETMVKEEMVMAGGWRMAQRRRLAFLKTMRTFDLL